MNWTGSTLSTLKTMHPERQTGATAVTLPPAHDEDAWCALARSVIEIEAVAVQALGERIDASFERACRLLLACKGRVVVCGIGKSGHIGHKIAATLASTGTPAFFVHAAEASHGDLGMLCSDDVLVALSNSGSSHELLTLIPGIKRLGIPLISLCGAADSPLASAADVHLDVSVAREACPLNLAPTASTTAALVMGDALAIALLGARGFTEQDFARSHPGGRLGRRLIMRVQDLMISGDARPLVEASAPLTDALYEISRKGLGMVVVMRDAKPVGIFTDGDLRRTIDRGDDIRSKLIGEVMTPGGHTVGPQALAVDAVTLMQEKHVTTLPVVDGDDLVGVIAMHALVASGVA